MLADLSGRADVALLVCRFYAKVRKDRTLAPIFNTAITDWEPHLEKLTDFGKCSFLAGVHSTATRSSRTGTPMR